jgi:trans-2-enoyl-CoA reductase
VVGGTGRVGKICTPSAGAGRVCAAAGNVPDVVSSAAITKAETGLCIIPCLLLFLARVFGGQNTHDSWIDQHESISRNNFAQYQIYGRYWTLA